MTKARPKLAVLLAVGVASALAAWGLFAVLNSNTPKAQEARALNLVGKASDPSGELSSAEIEDLKRLVKSDSPEVRMTAYGALCSIKEGPYHQEACSLIDGMKKDPDEMIRKGYIVKAYAAKKPGWEAELKAFLADSDPEIRKKAERIRDHYESRSKK